MLMPLNNILSRSFLFLIFGALMAACQSPSPPPAPSTETLKIETPTPIVPTATVIPTPEPEMPVKDTVHFAILADVTSTNVWALYDFAESSYWNHAVQDGYWPVLFTLSDQRFDFIPSLAEDFPSDFAQEGDLWVSSVGMKDGPTWSDGTPITADDVAFTANTALTFELGLNWNNAYDPDFLDRVEAIDAQTVKFFFKQKPGLSRWQYGALQGKIVNKAYWEPKISDALAIMEDIKALDLESEEYIAKRTEAVGMLHALDNTGEPTAGPYLFSRWEVGSFAENVRNPEYYFAGRQVEEFANGAYRESIDGKYEFEAYGNPTGNKVLDFNAGPNFESLLYSLYDQDAAVLALRNDEVDFILSPSGLSSNSLTQLRDDPAIQIVENEQNGFRYLAFNHDRPHLADPVLHQAIACMIDLDFLTEQLLQGQASPVYSIVPPGNAFWYNEDVPRFCDGMDTRERMEEAVSMLKASGYSWETEPAWNQEQGGSVDLGTGLMTPGGTLFPAVTLLAPNPGYDPLRATTALFVEQWMRQLGIPVTAELTNFNNIRTIIYGTGDYDMFILGWGFDGLFPDHACDLFVAGNPYYYLNIDLDELCSRFNVETDLEEARQQMDLIQEILATDLPYIYLFTTPVYDAYRNVEYPYRDVLGGIGAGFFGLPAYTLHAEP
jgi:ABC-type transport system substrate-binding protein